MYLEVYLVSGALGFATFENIQYVFISGGSGDQMFSKSVLISELFVLLLRVLMPIHVICAVLQAINLSKVSESDIVGDSDSDSVDSLLSSLH
jgi:RsiW-degrading membrane proteinase PrsW (M82 family)